MLDSNTISDWKKDMILVRRVYLYLDGLAETEYIPRWRPWEELIQTETINAINHEGMLTEIWKDGKKTLIGPFDKEWEDSEPIALPWWNKAINFLKR